MSTKMSLIFIFCSVRMIAGSRNTGSSSRTIEGLINKNAKPGTEVWLKSDLVVQNWQGMNGEVCGYGVKHPQLEPPFRVILLNPATGLAKVVVGEGKSLDLMTSHVTDVYPYDCNSGAHGLKTRLVIKIYGSTVQAFDRSFYEGFIFEREFDSKIVCLESSENTSADVCNEHVITPSVPFNVDEFGCIYNTRVLDFNSEKVMTFQVLAEYCNDQGVSVPVEVNIKVLCNHLNWEELKNVNITHPKGDDDDDDDEQEVNVMSNAKLDLCDESCIPSMVTTSLHLKLSPPLDQEVESSAPYPLQTLYKLCGVLLDVLDLLPSRSEPNSWTRNLPTNEKEFQHFFPEFNFNGLSTSSEIFLDQSVERFVDFPFSVSWAMQRNMFVEDVDDSEHLMCFVSEVDSRQYVKFSVSLHKCQLLLRFFRDSDTSPNITNDRQKSWHGESRHLSEWSWSLEGVCDGDWHDYVISLDLEKIILLVDRRIADEILFDEHLLRGSSSRWKASLHKFYVGACKHEESGEMRGFLKASVSGLHVLLNKTSNNNINNCLQSFEDKLQLPEKHSTFAGDVESFNVTTAGRSKKVTISAKSIDAMEKLTSRVVHVKSPLPTTPWKRNVHVQTSVECQDGRKLMAEDLLINIQQQDAGIKTSEVNENSKTAGSGQDLIENVRLNLSRVQSFKEADYKNGVHFMKDLNILSNEKTKSKELILLDACLVQFSSKLDKDKDKITGFDVLASRQHLIVAIYDFGISFTGVGRPQDYEMLLRSVSLETRDTSRKRNFNVGCSFRGKQTRNLSVMLDVIHEDHVVVKGHQNPHRLLSNKVIHPAMFDNLQLIAKPFPVSFKYNTADDSGAGVALVMIVCIGFIVLLIVLGIVRIRSLQVGEDSNLKASVEDPEFNIILNPIHPDNISKKEDAANECFHDRNKLNVDCEDSDEESFGISEETQRDWKNSAVLL